MAAPVRGQVRVGIIGAGLIAQTWHREASALLVNVWFPLATPTAQFERSMVRERVLEEIRGLLQELGSAGAMPMLNGSSHLERDLGLGSLERVELMARLENAFGVRIADQAATQANTPDDLAQAVMEAPESVAETSGVSAVGACVKVQQQKRKAEEAGVVSAETLIDVLHYRAAHDASRTHLVITEDADGQDKTITMTFGELHAAAQRCSAELMRRGVTAGSRVALMLLDLASVFCFLCGNFAGGSDSRADLSAISRRSN